MYSPPEFRDKRLVARQNWVENCKLTILSSENQVHTTLAFHLKTVLKHALDSYVLTEPFNLP